MEEIQLRSVSFLCATSVLQIYVVHLCGMMIFHVLHKMTQRQSCTRLARRDSLRAPSSKDGADRLEGHFVGAQLTS